MQIFHWHYTFKHWRPIDLKEITGIDKTRELLFSSITGGWEGSFCSYIFKKRSFFSILRI